MLMGRKRRLKRNQCRFPDNGRSIVSGFLIICRLKDVIQPLRSQQTGAAISLFALRGQQLNFLVNQSCNGFYRWFRLYCFIFFEYL